MHQKLFAAIAVMLSGMVFSGNLHAEESVVVLELFTSQGCSSCPPADALLKALSMSDTAILPLSFHVHYWDNLGWKDTYSSPANTDRQRVYSEALNDRVYTPQLVVNGSASMVGSDENTVRQAITTARKSIPAVSISIAPADDKNHLVVNIRANNTSSLPAKIEILKALYDPYAKTPIGAGENGGRILESINNVTSLESLGEWETTQNKIFSIDLPASGGVAILVQALKQGAILGAASYQK